MEGSRGCSVLSVLIGRLDPMHLSGPTSRQQFVADGQTECRLCNGDTFTFSGRQSDSWIIGCSRLRRIKLRLAAETDEVDRAIWGLQLQSALKSLNADSERR